MSDVFYNPLELAHAAGAQEVPPSGQTSVYAKANGHLYLLSPAGVETLLLDDSPGGSGHIIVQTPLAANVSMTNSNTGYNGPSVVLTTGVWLVWGQFLARAGNVTRVQCSARIWDLTVANTIAQYNTAFNDATPLFGNTDLAEGAMFGIATVTGASATYTLTVYSTGAGATMLRYPISNGVTTVPDSAATKLTALRIMG